MQFIAVPETSYRYRCYRFFSLTGADHGDVHPVPESLYQAASRNRLTEGALGWVFPENFDPVGPWYRRVSPTTGSTWKTWAP